MRSGPAPALLVCACLGVFGAGENFIVEKNFSADEGLEFGYSAGVYRSLGGLASGTTCHLCAENFVVGVEAYGGLGASKESGLANTRQYIAPVLAWHVTDRTTLKVSNGFGVTSASDRYLLRVGRSYEFSVPRGR